MLWGGEGGFFNMMGGCFCHDLEIFSCMPGMFFGMIGMILASFGDHKGSVCHDSLTSFSYEGSYSTSTGGGLLNAPRGSPSAGRAVPPAKLPLKLPCKITFEITFKFTFQSDV